VGQSSTLPLTITNSGNATLTISRLITSMSAPSTFSTTVQGANTIAAGGSLQVTVTFKPGAVGSYSGMLQVDGDHTSGTDKMDMSGSGVAAVALPVR
jgi:uncharacterized membrane protein